MVDIAIGEPDIQGVIDANPAGTEYRFLISPNLTYTDYPAQQFTPKVGDSFVSDIAGRFFRFNALITVGGWTFDGGSGLWFSDGHTETPDTSGDANLNTATSPRANWAFQMYRNKQGMIHKDSTGSLVSGSYYFDTTANRIWVFDDPAGQLIEKCDTSLPTLALGIADNITFRGIAVWGYCPIYQQGAIHQASGASNWLTEDFEIAYCSQTGIRFRDLSALRHGRIHQIGVIGYGATAADNSEVYNNKIFENNVALSNENWEAGGGKIANTETSVVIGNWLQDNFAKGLWWDIDNFDVLAMHNIGQGQDDHFIYHEIGFTGVFELNWTRENEVGGGDSVGGTAPIRISNSKGVNQSNVIVPILVRGNVVQSLNDLAPGAENRSTIFVTQDNRGTSGVWGGTLGEWLSNHIRVHGNRLIYPNDNRGRGGITSTHPTLNTVNVEFAKNQYEVDVANRFHYKLEDVGSVQLSTAQASNHELESFEINIDPLTDLLPVATKHHFPYVDMTYLDYLLMTPNNQRTYKFNEGSGTAAIDRSNAQNGVYSGGFSFVAGIGDGDQAVNFDGIDGMAQLYNADLQAILDEQNITLEILVDFPTAMLTNSINNYFVHLGTGNAANEFQIGIRAKDTNNAIRFSIGNNTSARVFDTALAVGGLHHFAVVAGNDQKNPGSNIIRYYMDGVEVGSQAIYSFGGSSSLNNNFTVATDNGTIFTECTVYYVKLHNKTLSQIELQKNMNYKQRPIVVNHPNNWVVNIGQMLNITDVDFAKVDSAHAGNHVGINFPPSLSVDGATGNITGTLLAGEEGLWYPRIEFTENSDPDRVAIMNFEMQVDPIADNPPTVVLPIADKFTYEDYVIADTDLTLHFDDIEDGTALDYTVSGNDNPTLVTPSIIGAGTDQLHLLLGAGQTGMANITIRATDSALNFVEDTFLLTVDPQTPPTVTVPIPDKNIVENGTIPNEDLTTHFNDIQDGTALIYTIENNTNPALITPSIIGGDQLQMLVTPDTTGVATLTIRATDNDGMFVEDVFSIIVSPGEIVEGCGDFEIPQIGRCAPFANQQDLTRVLQNFCGSEPCAYEVAGGSTQEDLEDYIKTLHLESCEFVLFYEQGGCKIWMARGDNNTPAQYISQIHPPKINTPISARAFKGFNTVYGVGVPALSFCESLAYDSGSIITFLALPAVGAYFTVPSSGLYYVNAQVAIQQNSAAYISSQRLDWLINFNLGHSATVFSAPAAAGVTSSLTATFIACLSAGTLLSPTVVDNAGTGYTILGTDPNQTYMEILKLADYCG